MMVFHHSYFSGMELVLLCTAAVVAKLVHGSAYMLVSSDHCLNPHGLYVCWYIDQFYLLRFFNFAANWADVLIGVVLEDVVA